MKIHVKSQLFKRYTILMPSFLLYTFLPTRCKKKTYINPEKSATDCEGAENALQGGGQAGLARPVGDLIGHPLTPCLHIVQTGR